MDTHFPESITLDLETGNILETHEGAGSLTVENCGGIVSEERFKWAITSLEPYKLAGADGIFPTMLHNSLYPIKDKLKEILKASLRLGLLPNL